MGIEVPWQPGAYVTCWNCRRLLGRAEVYPVTDTYYQYTCPDCEVSGREVHPELPHAPHTFNKDGTLSRSFLRHGAPWRSSPDDTWQRLPFIDHSRVHMPSPA